MHHAWIIFDAEEGGASTKRWDLDAENTPLLLHEQAGGRARW